MRSRSAWALPLFFSGFAWSQEKPARLTFDVASIRRSDSNSANQMIKALPGGHGYTAVNIPVRLMIALMWKVPARQVEGGPEWITSERYDVEARVDGSYSLDDLHTMFQHLLEDRLSLRFHREAREGNVYALVVDSGGVKMKPHDGPVTFDIPVTFGADGTSLGRRVDMEYLTWWLGQMLQRDERPVIDQTGLKGFWDFDLRFQPLLPPDATPPDDNRPTLFNAVREQLGLKLTAQKGPVQFFMIDHVERPSEN
jgi:uncharacterized protein (TIGR03435 family)